MAVDIERFKELSTMLFMCDNVRLTLTERRMMLMLLSRAPEPVPWADLAASWPQGRKPNAAAVRKMVSALRRTMRPHTVHIDHAGEGRYFIAAQSAGRAIKAIAGEAS